MPRDCGGQGAGVVLSLLVHVALILALAFGLNWRSRLPEAVEAELWAAVPQVAAAREVVPAPVPAPKPDPKPVVVQPPPRQLHDAQIAIEQARRAARKIEAENKRAELARKRVEVERKRAELARKRVELERKRAELAKKRAEDDSRIAAQREANLKRMLGQAGATATTPGQSVRSAGPSASYAARIRGRIKPNIVYTAPVAGDLVTEVDVRCAPDGRILSRKLVKSSGIDAWDQAVLRAIDKTEVLPRDTDGTVPSLLSIEFNARDF